MTEPDSETPRFHAGGLVKAADDGTDLVPLWFNLGCGRIFTAEQVKQVNAEAFAALERHYGPA